MINKPYSLIIFDWEGTLGEDIIGQVMNALDAEAQRLKLGKFSKIHNRQYLDLGIAKAIPKIFPNLTQQQYEQLLDSVQYTLATCSQDVCLVPGAKQFIEILHNLGKKLAIATNRGQSSLQRALRHAELDALFPVTRSAGQVPPKPCPQMLEEIMDECGVDAHQTLMIGDSLADIEMAKAINVDAIGVDFYEVNSAQLYAAGACAVVHNYQQMALLLGLNQGDKRVCSDRLA